jgi:hypothetical protein
MSMNRPPGNIRRPPGLKIACFRKCPSAPVLRDLHGRAKGANQNCCSIKGTNKLLPREHTNQAICRAPTLFSPMREFAIGIEHGRLSKKVLAGAQGSALQIQRGPLKGGSLKRRPTDQPALMAVLILSRRKRFAGTLHRTAALAEGGTPEGERRSECVSFSQHTW